jgi:CBS domain-containing protein
MIIMKSKQHYNHLRVVLSLTFFLLSSRDPHLIDMLAAPLWDPASCQFVGILTVTDFIDVLRHYKKTQANPSTLGERSIGDVLADQSINTLKRVRPDGSLEPLPYHAGFPSADASATLKQACLLLNRQSIDFLPILMPDDMRVLAIVTYTNILEHLVTHFREERRLFDDTIYDLGIGTYGDKLITARPNQTLSEALDLLQQHSLSALPVVDPTTRKLVGVYSRSDITFLAPASDAEDAIANLDLTLENILSQARTDVTTPDALHTCTIGHTLQSIFEYFAQLRFNRLYAVDEKDCVVGVVSARDLVAYFLDE